MANLPPPAIVASHRPYTRQACPRCGDQTYRDKHYQRTLHDLGHLDLGCPRELVVPYAQHHCTPCRQYCHAALADPAPPGRPYTPRGMELAVRLGGEDGWPYRPARWPLWRDHRGFVPCTALQHWVEARGKKGAGPPGPDFLDGAWAHFAGYVAADAGEDGPCCLLSAVAHRRDHRLLYDVLDHDPDHDDIRAVLRRLQTAWTTRALTLWGVPTAGAALSPAPLVEVCGDGPQPIWTFPRLAEVGPAGSP